MCLMLKKFSFRYHWNSIENLEYATSQIVVLELYNQVIVDLLAIVVAMKVASPFVLEVLDSFQIEY